jgi:hypothetical protein
MIQRRWAAPGGAALLGEDAVVGKRRISGPFLPHEVNELYREVERTMKGNWSVLVRLLTGGLLLWTILPGIPTNSGFKNGTNTVPDAVALSAGRTMTVGPTEIDDILYNPGMGLADFHFGIGSPLPSSQHPRSTVAYVRWYWADLEPAEGQYDFRRVDSLIEQVRAVGETLAFRIMTVPKTPQWLRDKGVAGVTLGNGIFPDFNNPIFLASHRPSGHSGTC